MTQTFLPQKIFYVFFKGLSTTLQFVTELTSLFLKTSLWNGTSYMFPIWYPFQGHSLPSFWKQNFISHLLFLNKRVVFIDLWCILRSSSDSNSMAATRREKSSMMALCCSSNFAWRPLRTMSSVIHFFISFSRCFLLLKMTWTTANTGRKTSALFCWSLGPEKG